MSDKILVILELTPDQLADIREQLEDKGIDLFIMRSEEVKSTIDNGQVEPTRTLVLPPQREPDTRQYKGVEVYQIAIDTGVSTETVRRMVDAGIDPDDVYDLCEIFASIKIFGETTDRVKQPTVATIINIYCEVGDMEIFQCIAERAHELASIIKYGNLSIAQYNAVMYQAQDEYQKDEL